MSAEEVDELAEVLSHALWRAERMAYRLDGQHVPKVQPQQPANFRDASPSSRSLTCTCGESFLVDSWEPTRALITHTLIIHGRPPHRSERIPKEVAA